MDARVVAGLDYRERVGPHADSGEGGFEFGPLSGLEILGEAFFQTLALRFAEELQKVDRRLDDVRDVLPHALGADLFILAESLRAPGKFDTQKPSIHVDGVGNGFPLDLGVVLHDLIELEVFEFEFGHLRSGSRKRLLWLRGSQKLTIISGAAAFAAGFCEIGSRLFPIGTFPAWCTISGFNPLVCGGGGIYFTSSEGSLNTSIRISRIPLPI
jgi:hypothetical protein